MNGEILGIGTGLPGSLADGLLFGSGEARYLGQGCLGLVNKRRQQQLQMFVQASDGPRLKSARVE